MNTAVALTVLCLLAGMPAPRAAPSSAAAWTLAIYKLSEQAAHCPANMHAQLGCVQLKGKALSAGTWSNMQRIAAVNTAAHEIPAGCVTATTVGTLVGEDGTLHFTGAGYYCPKTDTAWYRLDFDAAGAKHYDLPQHGFIHYRGKDNTETFTVPKN